MPEKWLSIEEVCELLGVNERTPLEWIDTKAMRAVDVSRKANERPRWRIAESDLQAFLAARSSTPETPVSETPAPKVTRRRRRRETEPTPEFVK